MIQKHAVLALLLTATAVVGFAPTTSTRAPLTVLFHTTAKDQQFAHLEDLAHKLRLRVFDVDTGMSDEAS